METNKKLLSVNEAASALGLGRSLVYTLVASGELMSLKIGRSRRIPVTALDAFVARRLAQQDGYQAGDGVLPRAQESKLR